MIIYRPHRGSFHDSMKELNSFVTFNDLKAYVVKYWTEQCDGHRPFDVEDVVIDDKTVDDDRNGWHDTRAVCIKRFFDEDFMKEYGTAQCVGFCATDYIIEFSV